MKRARKRPKADIPASLHPFIKTGKGGSIAIRGERQVSLRLPGGGKAQFFVGELGWLKSEGSKVEGDEVLSVSELLSDIGAGPAADEAFPWVKSNTAYWFLFPLASRGGKPLSRVVKLFLRDRNSRDKTLQRRLKLVGALAPGGPSGSAENWRGWRAHQLGDQRPLSFDSLGRRIKTWIAASNVNPLMERRIKSTAIDFYEEWIRQSPVLKQNREAGGASWGVELFNSAKRQTKLGAKDNDAIAGAMRQFIRFAQPQTAPLPFRKMALGYAAIRALYGIDLSDSGDGREVKQFAQVALSLLRHSALAASVKRRSRWEGFLQRARDTGRAPLAPEARKLRSKRERLRLYRTFRLWLFFKHSLRLARAMAHRAGKPS